MVFLLAVWVLAANTIFNGSDDPDLGTVQQAAALDDAEDAGAAQSLTAEAVDRLALRPSLTPAPGESAPFGPAPDIVAAADAPPAGGSELAEPVRVASAVPTIGGAGSLLPPALVARAVEPVTGDRRAEEAVPLPRLRPAFADVPLPRPRPEVEAAASAPRPVGRGITDAEIAKHSSY